MHLQARKPVSFDIFNLHPRIMSNIKVLGYQNPTPIQSQSMPYALLGQDVLGLAQTGTGKTAAFALPIIQRLMTGSRGCVRALIVAPTRELAQQIHGTFAALCPGTGLKSMTLYGGVNIKPQIETLNQGVEIIIACPGRLLDHVKQKTVNLSKVEVLVLDEADHLLDMGFLPDVRRILRAVPKKRQSLLFSATMPTAIDQLAHEALTDPVVVEIDRSAPSKSVEQTLFPVQPHLKTELLIKILNKSNIESVLVFTQMKHTAKKVAAKLEAAGFRAGSLQGNLSQNRRMATMNGFRDGSLQILVATDIASRGIDVSSISHVINYDMPGSVETYIHRIGRTGRATRLGEAFTLITPEDDSEVRNIERVLGKKLKKHLFDDFNYAAAGPSRGTLGSILKKSTAQGNRRRWQ